MFPSESTNKTDSQHHKTMQVRRQLNAIVLKDNNCQGRILFQIFKKVVQLFNKINIQRIYDCTSAIKFLFET